MTKSELSQKLTDTLQNFSDDIRSKYSESSKNPVTDSDIALLAKDVYYIMDDFKKFILEYLD